jgi:hypothetical protein
MPTAALDRFAPASVYLKSDGIRLSRLGLSVQHEHHGLVKWLNDTAETLQVTATALKWRLVALERLDTTRAKEIPDSALRNNGRDVSKSVPPPLYSKAFIEVIALAIDEGQLSARKAADLLDMSIDHLAELASLHGVELKIDL